MNMMDETRDKLTQLENSFDPLHRTVLRLVRSFMKMEDEGLLHAQWPHGRSSKDILSMVETDSADYMLPVPGENRDVGFGVFIDKWDVKGNSDIRMNFDRSQPIPPLVIRANSGTFAGREKLWQRVLEEIGNDYPVRIKDRATFQMRNGNPLA